MPTGRLLRLPLVATALWFLLLRPLLLLLAHLAAPAAPQVAASKVTFAADAFFDFDKSVLKPEGRAKLTDLVEKIRGVNLEVIIAVGHTDSIGTDAYNQRLSVRRAEAVKAFLVSKGIERNRVYTEGKGEKQPVADNRTKEGRAKNRRVEIEVVGTRAN
jgi:OOP family OmpA-OmpF porin